MKGIAVVADNSFLNKSASAGKVKESEERKLEKACKDFESFFVYYMLKTMRNSSPKSNFLGNSSEHDTYKMILDQKIAESIANRGGGLGIQKMLLDQLIKRK